MDNIMLNVDVLHPHPKNPRKDLGDVTELADSIKKNGIMQNLTVIPGHWDEKGKFNESEYTLLIGHRRFSAAKAAGLTELPCRVVKGLSESEQISTMLEENMQRNDLTIWEQSNSFAILLALGFTMEDIIEKTGFSETTVKHRLNIAKLDQKYIRKIEKDDSFQLTLTDLYELEKIESIDIRNKILKEASNSRELIWRARNAAVNEKIDKRAVTVYEAFKAAGLKKASANVEKEFWSSKWERVREIHLRDKDPKLPKSFLSAISPEWVYLRRHDTIYILKPAPKIAKAEKKIDPREANKKELKKNVAVMMKRKKDFIRLVIEGKLEGIKEEFETCSEIFDVLVDINTYLGPSEQRAFFTGKPDYSCKPEEKDEADKNISKLGFMQKMLIQLDYAMDNIGELMDWSNRYVAKRAENLKKSFEILKKWGWVFEEGEEAILDGTSELYEEK